jgi:hypothetical protein
VPGISTPTGTPTDTTSGASTPQSQPPIEGVSSSTLTFSATQGKANPAGQTITIVNSGGSILSWMVSDDSSWLNIAPANGSIAAGQTGQVRVNVDTAGLTPGTYNASVTVSAIDSSGSQVQGSPQVVSVTLTILQPCTLQVTPGSLSYSVSTLQPDSAGQNITLSETGNCAFPISWKASTDQSWIILSVNSGTNGGSSTITVHVKANSLQGHFSGQITLTAVDNNGSSLAGGSQTVLVTMDVSLL